MGRVGSQLSLLHSEHYFAVLLRDPFSWSRFGHFQPIGTNEQSDKIDNTHRFIRSGIRSSDSSSTYISHHEDANCEEEEDRSTSGVFFRYHVGVLRIIVTIMF
jgi:uncharacterized protein YdiU (UPF0061 family)